MGTNETAITPQTPPEKWTKLDKAKLRVDILSLIMTTILTIVLFAFGQRLASSQWTNQKLVEKRIALYDKLMPLFNDILCYQNLYGNFKELSPIDIVDRKRQLDKIFYTQREFFSDDFKTEYKNFMDLCFEPYSGMYVDAKIKSQLDLYKDGFTKFHSNIKKDTIKWSNDWTENFTNKTPASGEIEKSYYKLMDLLGKDIGIKK